MTYNEICRRLAGIYDEHEAKAMARALIEDLFGFTLADILCGAVDRLTATDSQRLSTAVERLEKMEPLQYVTGKAPFADKIFHVEPGVLIPRPETEQLCSIVAGDFSDNNKSLAAAGNGSYILDIGTGSGCIAITLALDIQNSRITAWDISSDALAIAEGNAARLGAKVCFKLQDALAPPDDVELWDAIVSNPPYICDSERNEMSENVLAHEPHRALFVPDCDPLLFYRAIARYGQKALKHGGRLYFEINERYAVETEDMLREMGYDGVHTEKDIFGKDRNTVAKRI